MSLNNVRSYTHEISLTWLPKHEPKKNSNRHANMDEKKPRRPQPYTRNGRQLKNSEGDKIVFREDHT